MSPPSSDVWWQNVVDWCEFAYRSGVKNIWIASMLDQSIWGAEKWIVPFNDSRLCDAIQCKCSVRLDNSSNRLKNNGRFNEDWTFFFHYILGGALATCQVVTAPHPLECNKKGPIFMLLRNDAAWKQRHYCVFFLLKVLSDAILSFRKDSTALYCSLTSMMFTLLELYLWLKKSYASTPSDVQRPCRCDFINSYVIIDMPIDFVHRIG